MAPGGGETEMMGGVRHQNITSVQSRRSLYPVSSKLKVDISKLSKKWRNTSERTFVTEKLKLL